MPNKREPGRLQQIENRLDALEQKQIVELDPESNYLILVPEEIMPSEFDDLCSSIGKFPNVTVISANHLELVKIT